MPTISIPGGSGCGCCGTGLITYPCCPTPVPRRLYLTLTIAGGALCPHTAPYLGIPMAMDWDAAVSGWRILFNVPGDYLIDGYFICCTLTPHLGGPFGLYFKGVTGCRQDFFPPFRSSAWDACGHTPGTGNSYVDLATVSLCRPVYAEVGIGLGIHTITE